MKHSYDNIKWVDKILKDNENFRKRIDVQLLPTIREPCPFAIITCMDPRVNLDSVGVLPFSKNGEIGSQVRIIRTLGGISENRSLVVGIFLGGMLAYFFSALLIKAVSRAAFGMIGEIRQQFKKNPKILQGKSLPNYSRCIDISTKVALKGMIVPGLLVVLSPPVIGFSSAKSRLYEVLASISFTGSVVHVMWMRCRFELSYALPSIESIEP